MRTFRGTAANAMVTTVRLEEGPGHDRVHIWNRGGKAGVLTVNVGDGIRCVWRLFGPSEWEEEQA